MTHSADLWTTWARTRDGGAFEALVRPELPHALGFARRLGCSGADAEDAVQEALARLAAVRDDAPVAIGVRAWLCREVHVRAGSRLRSERRRRARESSMAVADAHIGGHVDVDARDAVERALSELDDDARVAVGLRYLHDLDYREMAVVLGASEGACRQRVHKALAGLRARIAGDAESVNLDRTGLRDLVLPSVDSTDLQVRRYAWPALIAVGVEPPDVVKLREQALEGPKELRIAWNRMDGLRCSLRARAIALRRGRRATE